MLLVAARLLFPQVPGFCFQSSKILFFVVSLTGSHRVAFGLVFFSFFFFVALRFVSAIDDLGVFVNYRGLLVLGLISALFLLHSKERDKSRKWQPRNCPYPCPSMTFQAIF